MSTRERIRFECPVCAAVHDRGMINGVDVFRCLRCGYVGHGFSVDPEADRLALEEHDAANAYNRVRGIEEVPLGVDPLNGPG
jgi:ribosomal protein L37AE/L43A